VPFGFYQTIKRLFRCFGKFRLFIMTCLVVFCVGVLSNIDDISLAGEILDCFNSLSDWQHGSSGRQCQ